MHIFQTDEPMSIPSRGTPLESKELEVSMTDNSNEETNFDYFVPPKQEDLQLFFQYHPYQKTNVPSIKKLFFCRKWNKS